MPARFAQTKNSTKSNSPQSNRIPLFLGVAGFLALVVIGMVTAQYNPGHLLSQIDLSAAWTSTNYPVGWSGPGQATVGAQPLTGIANVWNQAVQSAAYGNGSLVDADLLDGTDSSAFCTAADLSDPQSLCFQSGGGGGSSASSVVTSCSWISAPAPYIPGTTGSIDTWIPDATGSSPCNASGSVTAPPACPSGMNEVQKWCQGNGIATTWQSYDDGSGTTVIVYYISADGTCNRLCVS